MTETISWWRHEPERTATGFRWLDWLTKPYWQMWAWWQTHRYHKAVMDRRFPLDKAEMELIECRAVLAELWDVAVVHKERPDYQLLIAISRQLYPSGENQDAV